MCVIADTAIGITGFYEVLIRIPIDALYAPPVSLIVQIVVSPYLLIIGGQYSVHYE